MQTKAKTVVVRQTHARRNTEDNKNQSPLGSLFTSKSLVFLLYTHLFVNLLIEKCAFLVKLTFKRARKKTNLYLDILCIKQICQTLNNSNCQNIGTVHLNHVNMPM